MVSRDATVSERLVQAVATATDTDPLELPPLYDAVDPDALDAMVEGMADGRVSFTYAGCEITVTAEGAISVDGAGTARSRAGTATASD